MFRIVITRRANDRHACIKGEPGYWACGRNPSEAIGELVRSHRERFGVEEVEIKYPAPGAGSGGRS